MSASSPNLRYRLSITWQTGPVLEGDVDTVWWNTGFYFEKAEECNQQKRLNLARSNVPSGGPFSPDGCRAPFLTRDHSPKTFSATPYVGFGVEMALDSKLKGEMKASSWLER